MARTQTLVQLNSALLAALDEQSARTGRSRSELIRDAITQYLRDGVEAEIDRQIVDAYRRCPPETIWGDDAGRALIAAEPW